MKVLKSARFEFYPLIHTVRFAIGTGKSYRNKELMYDKEFYSTAEKAWKLFLQERDPQKKNIAFGHALNMPTKDRNDLRILAFAIDVLWHYGWEASDGQ